MASGPTRWLRGRLDGQRRERTVLAMMRGRGCSVPDRTVVRGHESTSPGSSLDIRTATRAAAGSGARPWTHRGVGFDSRIFKVRGLPGVIFSGYFLQARERGPRTPWLTTPCAAGSTFGNDPQCHAAGRAGPPLAGTILPNIHWRRTACAGTYSGANESPNSRGRSPAPRSSALRDLLGDPEPCAGWILQRGVAPEGGVLGGLGNLAAQ